LGRSSVVSIKGLTKGIASVLDVQPISEGVLRNQERGFPKLMEWTPGESDAPLYIIAGLLQDNDGDSPCKALGKKYVVRHSWMHSG
jgi:hypothetical protein